MPRRALAVARATGQGELFLVLAQILGGVWRARGKLAEAAELLDGGDRGGAPAGQHAGARLEPLDRSAVALAVGDVELALATAQESVDLSRDLDDGFHSAGAAAEARRVLLETGQPERAVELLLGSAGGEELSLIPGSRRASLPRAARRAAGSRSTAEPRRSAQPRPRRPGPRRCSSRWPPPGPIERPRPSTCTPATPPEAAEQALVGGRGRRRGRRADRGRAVAHARGPRARPGRPERPCRRGATARGRRVRSLRRTALPRRGGTGAGKARPSRPPAHAPGQGRRDRARIADRPRAPGRAARRRPQDQSRDRRRAVPQQEDGRDPPAQHLPQAGRLVTRRAGACRRARRPRRAYWEWRAVSSAGRAPALQAGGRWFEPSTAHS